MQHFGAWYAGSVDRLVRLARWFGANPSAQLVVGGLVLLVAFPGSPIGTIGRLIAYAALGIGVAMAWPSLPSVMRTPRLTTAIAVGGSAVIGIALSFDAGAIVSLSLLVGFLSLMVGGWASARVSR